MKSSILWPRTRPPLCQGPAWHGYTRLLALLAMCDLSGDGCYSPPAGVYSCWLSGLNQNQPVWLALPSFHHSTNHAHNPLQLGRMRNRVLVLQLFWPPMYYTVRKGYQFSRPQPGCHLHLPNFSWAGIINLFPPRESLVSDIPSGDGKINNLFLQCNIPSEDGCHGVKIYTQRT